MRPDNNERMRRVTREADKHYTTNGHVVSIRRVK
jgi:hypothetical protein